jgi:SAM-dependent methyltransferase
MDTTHRPVAPEATPPPAATASLAGLPSPFDDGDLYDLMVGSLDYGLSFYLDLMKATGGPVLDVACGTGRILLPALRAGCDVEGLDLFAPMLDRLRHKAAELGLCPRLHRADMSDFRIDRRFRLIVIPFNAFVHNLTSDAQIRSLTRCREHLEPAGLLAFDTFCPGPELIMLPNGTRVLEGETPHPVTGHAMRMYDTRSFDRVKQIQTSVMDFEVLDAEGRVAEVHRSATELRWVYKAEMELLLRLAGFRRWEICSDFDRRPLEQDNSPMVVLAWND